MPTSYSSVEAIPRTPKKTKKKVRRPRENEALCPICGEVMFLSLEASTTLFELDDQGEIFDVDSDVALSEIDYSPDDYRCAGGHADTDIKAFCRMRAATGEYCRKAAKAGYPTHKDQAIFEVKVVNGPNVEYCDLYSPVYVISPPDGCLPAKSVEDAAHGFLDFVQQSEKLFGRATEFSLDQRSTDLYLSPVINDRRGNVFWVSNINPQAAFRTFDLLRGYEASQYKALAPAIGNPDVLPEALTDAVTSSTPPVSIPHEKTQKGPENASGDATPTTQYGF